ncbi:YCF48-related protein [Mucilaginibacter sp. RS28]|uniref:YCF48-related protein n=1 Tax=Mucilaginibacter straminoryzae TaxID=2932774 RepID=A0A9X1WZM1_9SPHI|nr:YCF48-related protein [Mucilaginibacter straminoryzae]MCJ8208552.1 YCF48-related protein [Mucilaginibacter straminoryzae]
MARLYFFLLVLLFAINCSAQKIEVIEQGIHTNIRGMSVLNDRVAWVSGSNGYVGCSANGGKTWRWQQVKGYEKSDFRDIEAFSEKEAVIISSGTPALILRTTDGGATWKACYRNEDKAYFLDAMDFKDSKHGYVLGDPIDGKFMLLETTDGGTTWNEFAHRPDAVDGEAAFAASGTCFRITGKSQLIIVTGGKATRVLTLQKAADHWHADNLGVKTVKESKGAFSVNETGTIVVGGDYASDKQTEETAFTRVENSSGWIESKVLPAGFQSCVTNISKDIVLSTGTSGTNISTDGGISWKQIVKESFNVCAKAKRGKLVLLAGANGRIALFKLY